MVIIGYLEDCSCNFHGGGKSKNQLTRLQNKVLKLKKVKKSTDRGRKIKVEKTNVTLFGAAFLTLSIGECSHDWDYSILCLLFMSTSQSIKRTNKE